MTSTKTSKFLSLVLRHEPQRAGITLDAEGWVDVDALLTGLVKAGHPLSRDRLSELVAENDKKRFTLSPDGARIRAAQGHSVPVALGLEPIAPPARLYHGTATRFLDAIKAEGLCPGSRQQVHLSLDVDTARKVGARHGKPVILIVDAQAMEAAGHAFFQADNGVWLTDAVPPEFLRETDG